MNNLDLSTKPKTHTAKILCTNAKEEMNSLQKPPGILFGFLPSFLSSSFAQQSDPSHFYTHTNLFCVVQKSIKPEVFKVQTELARSVH